MIAYVPATDTLGVLTITSGRTVVRYAVRAFPADGGRGFRLGKADGVRYDVFLSGPGGFDSCDCTGFLQHGKCKHVRTLRELADSGAV